MGVFDRKPKMSIQDWTTDFYSNYVFPTSIAGTDPWQVFCSAARDQVAQSDPTFSRVDSVAFSDQLLALRLEVVGLTWILKIKDDLSPKQSECTRLYLLNHNQERYWEMMEPYNQAVAKAVVGGSDSNTRTGRAYITFINEMRSRLFDKWVVTLSDPKDAARPANRIGSDVPWKAQKTHVYLSFELTDQLQCEVNEEARMNLMTLIQGFFNGASEELGKVKIIS